MIMVRQLDKRRPYGLHHPAIDDSHFSQDGFGFRADGSLIAEPEAAELPPPVDTTGPSTEAASLPSAEPKVKPDDMRLAANKAIRLQWENYHDGEDWPGLTQAREDLGITE